MQQLKLASLSLAVVAALLIVFSPDRMAVFTQGAIHILLVVIAARMGRFVPLLVMATAVSAALIVFQATGLAPMGWLPTFTVLVLVWVAVCELLRQRLAAERALAIASAPRPSAGSETGWTDEQIRAIHKQVILSSLSRSTLHLINNMLMVIHAHADTLSESLGEESELTELVGEIIEAADEMARATSDLQRFVRDEDGWGHPCCINRVVDGAMPLLRQLLPKTVTLDDPHGTDDEPWLVAMGEGRLLLLVMCLGDLLRDALRGGGQAVVRLDWRPLEEATAEERVLVRLTLEGRTERAEAERHARQRQLDQPRVAMSLKVARQIAGEHGGRIEVHPLESGGLRLTLALPASRENRPAAPDAALELTGTVILVEGHDYRRALTAGVLRGAGHEVKPCRDLDEALAAWKSAGDGLRLLVVDEAVLAGDIRVSIARLTEIGDDENVILVRASGSGETESLTDRFAHQLRKPYSMADLDAMIRTRFLAQRQKERQP